MTSAAETCGRAPLAAALAALVFASCAGPRPVDLGAADGVLAPCPPSPNCVSSAATDAEHRVQGFVLAEPSQRAWARIVATVGDMPRTNVVAAQPGRYLHAECRSLVFGFVDDLELSTRPEQTRIAIRSASRLGYSDMGVNRRRIETLRSALRAHGLLAE